jgi:3-phosphoshikimate 1-carboxyvinyltransferase
MEIPKFSQTFRGKIRVKGDKSISHRVLVLSGLSESNTKIYNLSSADDVKRTVRILSELGVEIREESSQNCVEVKGKGLYLNSPQSVLYSGNSGTTARIFSAILSAQKFPSVLDGDESLRKRPMKRVVEPLRELGAKIWGKNNGDNLPLIFDGVGKFRGGKNFLLSVPSAQVKTALLLANFWSDEPIKVKEPSLSRDHTERILPIFSVGVKKDEDDFIFCEGKPISPGVFNVPGDISSASFLLALGILGKDSEVEVYDVLLNPTRIGFIQALKSMGADIEFWVEREEGGEPVGKVVAKSSFLKAQEFKREVIPLMIDEIPILSFVAIFSDGVFCVRDAKELRVKETDRIRAICHNLRALGIEVEEYEDGFSFEGLGKDAVKKLKNEYYLKSFGDHRIAMSIFVLGCVIDGKIFVDDGVESVVSVSYPEFFSDVKSLSGKA